MANYGKILTPLGILLFIPSNILLISGINQQEAGKAGMIIGGGVGLFIAALFFIIGLARLVQGKERKILGQMLRPKAAARGSAIWTFVAVNLMPLILRTANIFEELEGPPFPLFIIGSGPRIVDLGYSWLPVSFIAFIIIWFIGFILSGKIPKIYYVFNIFFMILSFSFWMNLGIQFLLWALLVDKTGIFLVSPWEDATTFISKPFTFTSSLLVPFLIGLILIIFATLMILILMKRLHRGFSNFTVKGTGKVASFIALIIVYILSIAPLTFAVINSLGTDSYVAPYVNFIGVVFVAVIIFYTATALMNSIKDYSKQQAATSTKAKSPTAFGFKTAIFVVVLFLAWAPIVLPLVDQGKNSKDNSIYNTKWNGWSNFREEMERVYDPDDELGNVMSIQSSISTIGQLDPTKQVILVIPGPNKFYNPASEIPYFLTAFKTNFSMFVCSDQGSAGSLLLSMFFASLGVSGGDISKATPFTLFPKGILHDNESFWRDPKFPVIKQFSSHEITNGISNVVLGHATGFLGGDLLSSLGWSYLGYTSGQYSFIDTNDNGFYEPSIDAFDLPEGLSDALTSQDVGGTMALAGTILDQGLPLGGYPQAVFSYKEIGYRAPTVNGTFSSRVFCATDATWLDNELTGIPSYDNLQFATQAMEWLASGRDPEDVIIVFDEAHLLPTSGRASINSAASFGTTQGYVNWLSTNPIFGLFYPLFAVLSLRRWIPKEGSKKKLQLKDLEEDERKRAILKFRTSSFFAQKINWYRTHHKYRQALLQLFRRLQRKINRLLGDSGNRSVEAIMLAIRRERGRFISKNDYIRIQKFFEFMRDLKLNKANIKDEREFEDHFLEMGWINDKI